MRLFSQPLLNNFQVLFFIVTVLFRHSYLTENNDKCTRNQWAIKTTRYYVKRFKFFHFTAVCKQKICWYLNNSVIQKYLLTLFYCKTFEGNKDLRLYIHFMRVLIAGKRKKLTTNFLEHWWKLNNALCARSRSVRPTFMLQLAMDGLSLAVLLT